MKRDRYKILGQIMTAEDVANELSANGHDVTALDVLDALTSIGVGFTPSRTVARWAADAYARCLGDD